MYDIEYLNFDVTNEYELISFTLLLFFDLLLFSLIFNNFRNILLWYYNSNKVDPKRLICLNSNLLLSVSCKINVLKYL
jgi:hypothetical protein